MGLLYYCKNREARRESEDSLELPYMDHDEQKAPDAEENDLEEKHGGHGESLSDLMIHQIIETIEFVLGFVSNTASYLRLWALSLAHAELAEVFWGKTMGAVINNRGAFNFILVFCAFAVWMVITVAVLLMMDVLECF